VYYTVEHIGKYYESLDMSNQRTLNEENNEPRMRNTLRWTPILGWSMDKLGTGCRIFSPFTAREGLVTWVDRGGGAGKGTRGAQEDRRRVADHGFLIIGYIIIESPSYPIPIGHNIYACRRRDWITRSLVPNGESSLTASELIFSETVIMNSWSQMIRGVNRLLPKEIMTMRDLRSQQTDFKTNYFPPLGFLGYGLCINLMFIISFMTLMNRSSIMKENEMQIQNLHGRKTKYQKLLFLMCPHHAYFLPDFFNQEIYV
jgi:hypothetical protein